MYKLNSSGAGIGSALKLYRVYSTIVVLEYRITHAWSSFCCSSLRVPAFADAAASATGARCVHTRSRSVPRSCHDTGHPPPPASLLILRNGDTFVSSLSISISGRVVQQQQQQSVVIYPLGNKPGVIPGVI